MIRHRLHRLACIAALSLAAIAAHAQDWPNAKPIKIVVPASAGSSVDNVTRMFAQYLQTKLGATVVVEDKPGALGAIAGTFVVKSAPDGYTFITGAQDTTILVSLVQKNAQFNPRELVPVAKISEASLLIAATPSTPFNNVADMVTYAKAHPGKLTFGSGGAGGIQHLSVELVKQRTGIDMLHVPYKSATDAANGFMAGDIQLLSASPTFLKNLIAQNKAKGIAIMRAQRHPLLPDVPTFAEAGIKDLNVASWVALFAPPGTPPDIVAKMSDAVVGFAAAQDFRTRLEATGQEATPIPHAEFVNYMNSEWTKWDGVVKAARIEAK